MRITKKAKSIISVALVVAIVAGVLALAGSIFGSDTKTIASTAFSVGAIDENGNYVESKTSIYTKDLIACDGLVIEPDFKTSGKYQVFYYDAEKDFLESTEVFDANDSYKKDVSSFFAPYCRILITPDVPLDDEGNEVEDFKIGVFDVFGYANDYKITVNKVQDVYQAVDNDTSGNPGKTYAFDDNNKIVEESADNTVMIYESFGVLDYSVLCFKMDITDEDIDGYIHFTDANGKKIKSIEYSFEDFEYLEDNSIALKNINVPKGAKLCYVVGCTAITIMAVYGK